MSWQLRLLNLQLRRFTKPRMARTVAPVQARAELEMSAELGFRPMPLLRHHLRPGRLHWFSAGPVRSGKVILYFHGGGYIAGSPLTYRHMLGRLSHLAKLEICAPAYPLAPEAPFPAAFDAALAAWARLRGLGFRPQDIVIGGDSAGGGLALALLARLCGDGTPPAGLFAFSPWTDLALTGESLTANRERDVLLPLPRVQEVIDLVVAPEDRRDPRASPLYAEFPGAPPVLMHYAETEILRDDTLRMAARLAQFDATVRLEAQENAPHVWHLFDGRLPEARASLSSVARFAQAVLAGAISR